MGTLAHSVALMQDHTRPFWWSATVGEGFSWSRGATTRIALLSSDRISVIWNLRVLDIDFPSWVVCRLRFCCWKIRLVRSVERPNLILFFQKAEANWSKRVSCGLSGVPLQVETAKREKETLEQKMKDCFFWCPDFVLCFVFQKLWSCQVVGIVWIGGVPCVFLGHRTSEKRMIKNKKS